jgi:molybdopterin/thiamine biosynthesis adenylyltransferase
VVSTSGPTRGGEATAVVVGLGNVGSHLVSHLARTSAIARVVLIDRDRYEEKNLRTQAIEPDLVGTSKAQAQGHRLSRINPVLGVISVTEAVQHVPLGRLRGEVILACVDSRAARQYLSQAARHLGVPLVDAGVRRDGLLARVSVIRPEPSAACVECSWTQEDYDHIEQTHPCAPGGVRGNPATNAPAWLGALAASLQAAECERILDGTPPAIDGSFETILDAAKLRQLTTRFRFNGHCRFDDHRAWVIETLDRAPDALTVAALLRLPAGRTNGGQDARLSMPAAAFVTRLTCLECGQVRETLRLRRAVTLDGARCPNCNGRLEAAGPDIVDALSAHSVPRALLDQPASALGLLPGDIVSVGRGGRQYHVQLGEAAA